MKANDVGGTISAQNAQGQVQALMVAKERVELLWPRTSMGGAVVLFDQDGKIKSNPS